MTASRGFQPGVSGNPSGRSKKDLELEAHARLHAKHAIDVAAQILLNTEASNSDRLKAAQLILDRGHGKPKEQVTVTHERPVTEWTEEQLDAAIAGLAGEARKGEGPAKSH
jgi:hypothetical protein